MSAKRKVDTASRRKFLSATVAGVAGLAVGKAAVADQPARLRRNMAPAVSPEEKAKEVKRAQAETMLRDLGDNVEIHWVKGNLPAARRIIQLKG